MYKLCPIGVYGEIPESVIRTSDGACIPFDPQNVDYIAYLEWVEQGGVPIPADEAAE